MKGDLIINISSTGLDTNSDKIIEIGFNLDGEIDVITVNPGKEISEGARPHIKITNEYIYNSHYIKDSFNREYILDKLSKANNLIFLNEFHYTIFVKEIERLYDKVEFGEDAECLKNKKVYILTKVFGEKMSIKKEEQKFITMDKMLNGIGVNTYDIDSKIVSLISADNVHYQNHPKIVLNIIKGYWLLESLIIEPNKTKKKKRTKSSFSSVEKAVLNSHHNESTHSYSENLGFNL